MIYQPIVLGAAVASPKEESDPMLLSTHEENLV